jgi:TPP-dependent pyruvate/acetoin dehydrogenase alpha subunit
MVAGSTRTIMVNIETRCILAIVACRTPQAAKPVGRKLPLKTGRTPWDVRMMDTRVIVKATQVNIDWPEVARLVMRSRMLDDLEESELAPSGEVPYQFSAKGHELAQVLLALHLDRPHDAAATYYRSRPFVLASGLTLTEALAAGMARTGSPSEGRDAGVVFSMRSRGRAEVLPESGDVGSQYTPAAGWAQAIRYHQRVLGEEDWGGSLAVALGGDGSVASSGFWSGLTIATTLQLPMLFFIEDNSFGLSVPSQMQTPGGDISVNLGSFEGLEILSGSGTDRRGRNTGARRWRAMLASPDRAEVERAHLRRQPGLQDGGPTERGGRP